MSRVYIEASAPTRIDLAGGVLDFQIERDGLRVKSRDAPAFAPEGASARSRRSFSEGGNGASRRKRLARERVGESEGRSASE